MKSKGALSSNWRINKSRIPAVELACGLKALSKVVGTIDPHSRQVVFGGMSANDLEGKIFIDRRHALRTGQYPIDDKDFDVLVGLAAHEAGHDYSESCEPGIGAPLSQSPSFPWLGFWQCAEDIYVDAQIRADFPVQGKYIDKAREAYNAPDDVIDWKNIQDVFMHTSLYGNPFKWDLIPPNHVAVFNILQALTTELKTKLFEPVDRIKLQQNFYEAICNLLRVDETREALTIPKKSITEGDMAGEYESGGETVSDKDLSGKEEKDDITDKDSTQDNNSNNGEDEDDDKLDDSNNGEGHQDSEREDKDSGDGDTPGEGLNPHPGDFHNLSDIVYSTDGTREANLLKDVEKALQSDSVDIGEQIEELMQEVHGRTVSHRLRVRPNTKRVGSSDAVSVIYEKSSNLILKDTPPRQLMKELDWIKRLKNTIMDQTFRGESEGTLDRRRLHRHYTDNRAYKVSRRIDRTRLDITLLLDASSSMDNKLDIYKAAQALHKVVPDSTVLCYDSMPNCTIQDCSHLGQMQEITPRGGTPSGRALLGAMIKNPRSLLIHFTDGESNVDLTPKDALEVIAQKYPKAQVVNIIMGQRETSYREEGQYPPDDRNYKTVTIQTIEEFPDVLKEAMKAWYHG